MPPELVTDFIGLKGDTSDNIPGVPGIGDKTAAQLLQQFGDLEGVLGSVDEISGAKRKQNLTEHADDARVSKQLATMVEDVEVPIEVTEDAALDARPLEAARRRERVRAAGRDPAPRRRVGRGRSRADGRGDDRGRGRGGHRPPISPRARSRSRSAAAAGRRSDGDRVVAGDAADLARARRRAPRPPAGRPRRQGPRRPRPASEPARPPPGPEGLDLAHDTMVAAYLIDPARRTYELHELAADAGLAAAPAGAEEGQLSLAAEEGDAAGDPAVDARLAGELAERQRAAAGRVRRRAAAERGRDAADRGARRDGADRPAARHRAAGRDRRRDGRADRRARARDLRARRARVHDRLAAAARRRCSSTSSG